MASLIRRPPARLVVDVPMQGLSNRQRYAAVDSDKGADLRRGSSTTQRSLEVTWQDLEQINAAHEQPRLIFYSGAAPFTRWGHRRFVRTFMSASPRFVGRWAFVGVITRAFAERGRITGTPGRSSLARTTYTYPRFVTAPRSIELWPVEAQSKPPGPSSGG